jgi:hypothetical protein
MSAPAIDDHIAPVVAALQAAAATERGRDIVSGHDEDYEICVHGRPAVIVRMRDGELSVVNVSEGKPAFCAYTRVEFDPGAVQAITAGTMTPAEAADNGGMLMRSRLYGGGQFMGLLRVAQKIDAFSA